MSHFYNPITAEPCHFVAKKDGKGNRPSHVGDARKNGWAPGPSTVLNVLSKPALTNWLVRQGVYAVVTAPDVAGESLDDKLTRILDVECQQDEESAIARDRGTDIHAAIELHLNGQQFDAALTPYVAPVVDAVNKLGRVVATEKILVGNGYAGKTDCILENEEAIIVVDFKGLAVDTPIPTPEGWATMGNLIVGDMVFGADGKPCKVIAKSKVHYRTCYRVSFDDSTSIIADNEHLWEVYSTCGKKRNPIILSTEGLAHNLLSTQGQSHLAIKLPAPLELPEASLSIPPYTLGCWLGDGSKSCGRISKPDDAMFERIKKDGFEIGASSEAVGKCPTRTVYGLRTKLRKLNLLRNKHIPIEYLRASVSQRIELLHGLMDTDGHWNRKRKLAVFNSANERLAYQVMELIVSLGHRAYLWKGTAMLNGKDHGDYFHLAWKPWRFPAFYSKKGVGVVPAANSGRRLITSVELIQTVPTQCIQVDSPDSLYLAGRQMVPTHNTAKNLPTKGAWPEHRMQAAAYTEAASSGGKRKFYVIIYISTTEPGKIAVFDHHDWQQDFQKFDLILRYWYLANGMEFPELEHFRTPPPNIDLLKMTEQILGVKP